MKKLLLLTALFISTLSYSQDFLWSHEIEGGDLLASQRDIEGNVYVLISSPDYLNMKVDGVSYNFPDSTPINPVDTQSTEFTILKYNKDGKFIMKSNFIIKGTDYITGTYVIGLTVDKYQNVYVALDHNDHYSELLIRQSPSTYTILDWRSINKHHIIFKLDANGYFEWYKEFSHTYFGSRSVLEASQNSESVYLIHQPAGEIEIEKYNANGDIEYTCEQGSGPQVSDFYETTDGSHFYTTTWGGYLHKYNSTTGKITNSELSNDITLIDSNATNTNLAAHSLCIDKNNNIYTTGRNVNIDTLFGFKLPQGMSGHIAKFDSDLNPQWIIPTNGLSIEYITVGEDRIFVVCTSFQNSMIGPYQFEKSTIIYAEIGLEGNIIIVESSSINHNWIGDPGSISINGALLTTPSEFGIVKYAANRVTGTVYYDLNSNNQYDIDENAIPNLNLTINNKTLITGNTGKYLTGVDSGVKYIITPQLLKYYTVNPTNDSVLIDATDSTAVINFALQPVGDINDLEVYITNVTPIARPGFNSVYRITAKNVGTTTLNSTVTYTYDSNMIFQSAGPKETSHTYPVLTWDINNFTPGEVKNFTVRFKVEAPPIVEFGDTIIHIIDIDPDDDDTTEDNNRDTFKQPVRGAYDPNIKEVNKPEIIDVETVNGSFPIEYTIHFQNTGNDTAFHVYLIDSLDADLKVETIEILSASHDYEFSISENNTLRWDYYNILLVDSNTNEPESHGFVKYRVWTKDNPGIGDEFTNNADIYFDFNEPVRTNTTKNTIDKIESVELIAGKTVTVYPNPTSGNINVTINLDAGVKAGIKVIDLTGKQVYAESTTTGADGLNQNINLANLPQGIYFVQVYANNQVYTAKVVKQ